jgi:hypothetical protein
MNWKAALKATFAVGVVIGMATLPTVVLVLATGIWFLFLIWYSVYSFCKETDK